MEKTVKHEHRAPHAGTFLRGFRSGAVNSGLMLGIFTGVGALINVTGLAALSFIGWPAIAVTVLTTGIFSGVMGVKKAKEPAGITPVRPAGRTTSVLIPTISPSLEVAQSPELDTRSDWAERTGRNSDSQSRVQQILANGSMTDKDRASAILSARENADTGHSLV